MPQMLLFLKFPVFRSVPDIQEITNVPDIQEITNVPDIQEITEM